jgi:hypothetical protein
VPRKSTTPPRKHLIKGKDIVVTAQQTIEEYSPERGFSNFLYRFRHPLRESRRSLPGLGQRTWLERLESLAGQTKNDSYIIIELIEAPQYSVSSSNVPLASINPY